MNIQPLTMVACAAGTISFIWFLLARRRNGLADARHGFCVKGGRGGMIEYRSADRIAHLPWELLHGPMDLGVSVKNGRWVIPKEAPFTSEEQSEILRRLDAWARDRRLRYEVD